MREKIGGLVLEEKKSNELVLISWVVMIIISAIPSIILGRLFNTKLTWLPQAQIIVLSLIFVISLFYNRLFPLRKYFGVFLVIFTTRELIIMARATEQWRSWFGGNSPSFMQFMIRIQLLLVVAIPIIFLVLLAIHKKPSLFYFSMGDINAKVKPVKWLGIKENTRWKRFGVQTGIFLTVGILVYLLSANAMSSTRKFLLVIKYIPVIMIFASVNAFYEEILYRASLLSVIEGVIGGKHALWITSLNFGIGHFFGVPSGIIGVILASFLGYILGKSILETRGFFWAFLLHFLMDFCIYIFTCLGFFA